MVVVRDRNGKRQKVPNEVKQVEEKIGVDGTSANRDKIVGSRSLFCVVIDRWSKKSCRRRGRKKRKKVPWMASEWTATHSLYTPGAGLDRSRWTGVPSQ